jgi:riboflavin synthase alpha subunit
MKNHFRRCLAAAASMALTAVLLMAADAAGTWKGSIDVNGTTVPLTFNLKTDGATVSGTIDGLPTEASEIKEGKVDGDSITFWCMTDYQGMPIKLVYKGKLAGDQINFTMATEDGGWSTDLVAKRGS